MENGVLALPTSLCNGMTIVGPYYQSNHSVSQRPDTWFSLGLTDPQFKLPLFLELKTQRFPHLRVNKLNLFLKYIPPEATEQGFYWKPTPVVIWIYYHHVVLIWTFEQLSALSNCKSGPKQ